MDDVEFAAWLGLMQRLVTRKRAWRIGKALDYGQIVQDPLVALRMCLNRFNQKPLIGVLMSDV